jgi:hypothetical protein
VCRAPQILICQNLRNNLQHPNEFLRGSTLRFLCRIKEEEILEPLTPSILVSLRLWLHQGVQEDLPRVGRCSILTHLPMQPPKRTHKRSHVQLMVFGTMWAALDEEWVSLQACLEHRHSFVRRNAVLAINALYKLPKGELLLQDAPELIEKVLQVRQRLRVHSTAVRACIPESTVRRGPLESRTH